MLNKKTLVIAEAGVNHNGDLIIAKQLVDVALEAGADVIKFQTFNANKLVTALAQKAEYQIESTSRKESQLEMLRQLELTEEMHHELVAYCASRKIDFLSTGFDIESVDFLVQLGQKKFKIPSGEITNLPYLRHIGQIGKPVILSTGMATLGEIEAAIDVLEGAGTPRAGITVLHCTTEYPTPLCDVNLLAMKTIQSSFGVSVGYSDHTQGAEVAIAAVAMGAVIIEKHLTLDKRLPGPDHQASMEPKEFIAMVAAIRNIEIALGDGVKRPTPSEVKNICVVRKSLVAKHAIKAGQLFTNENLTAKRPGTGVSPMRWDEFIGKHATRDFLADELIGGDFN